MTVAVKKGSPDIVAEAIAEGAVQVNVDTHRIVTMNKVNTLEDSNYFHLGCTMTAEVVLETDSLDVEIQEVGTTQFDIVDTTVYVDIDEIRKAVDMDDEANGDDLELWRMLDVIYTESLLQEDLETQNAILGGKIALMNNLKVDVDYRRVGAGTALINHLKNFLDVLDVHSIALIPAPYEIALLDSTWKDHRNNLLAFYEANGFKIIPVEDDYVALYLF